MDEKEKKELLSKILNVDADPKGARVAATVFINKANREEGNILVDYLDHHVPTVKKVVRNILGQMGIEAAVEPLIREFGEIIGSLTFLPDEEYKETHYYGNIIDILETLFNILKMRGIRNDAFFNRIDEVFKRTKNEDLRFTLIKLLALLGDRLEYLLKIYPDLTEKERRGLYFVYGFIDHPKRMQIFEKGLEDEPNFEYVVLNLLTFPQGKTFLSERLLNLGSYNKQTVLKKLQEGKYPEFNDTLIKLLSDKNKFLVELAIDNLKRSISTEASLQPFIDMIETGYSPEGIQGALEIIDHFVKRRPEDIYLQGLEKQPSQKNKTIILDFFIERLKKSIKITEHLTEKVMPRLLVYFDNYTKEKEDLFISIFKVFGALQYTNTNEVKTVKKKLVNFKKEFDNRLSTLFRNNFGEFLVRLNHILTRLEEGESKIKNIVVLFDIDPLKIDHPRMVKLKEQVTEVEVLDEATMARFLEFLCKMAAEPKLDWKVKTAAVDLLGDYGSINEIGVLAKAIDAETSLAVKTNAQKALKKIEERNADKIRSVLVMEPMFYLQKVLNEFFKVQAYRVFNLAEPSKFPEIADRDFKYIVISETLLDEDLTRELFDYVDNNLDSTLIVITGSLENWAHYQDIPNIKFLKKPFNSESLKLYLETLK